MFSLRALILGLMAMAFALSGIARAATPPGAMPPCHMASMMQSHEAPASKVPAKPASDMMAMNCCVGCLPTQAVATVLPTPIRTARPAVFERRQALREGLAQAPELGPPRTA